MNTQPQPPDADHDPSESQGLGPVIEKPKEEPTEEWFPVPGTQGRIETNAAGQWRTNIPPKG